MPIGDRIFKLLENATDAEVEGIWKALRLKGKPTGNRGVDTVLISKGYRSAAGQTVVDLFREDHAFEYKQILIDVADRAKYSRGWTRYKLDDSHTEEEIEEAFITFITERVNIDLRKMSKVEREYKAKEIEKQLEKRDVPSLVKDQVAGSVMAGKLELDANAPLALAGYHSASYAGFWAYVFQAIALLLGVFGLSVQLFGLWFGLAATLTVFLGMLGVPAYRKTIPATVQMIVIKRRLEAEL